MDILGFEIGWDDVKDVAKDVFSPKNIIDAVGIYGQSQAKADAAQTAASNLASSQAHESALLDKKFQQEIELMKLKASLSGGGGGGGSGVDMRPYIYQGKLKAAEAAMAGRQGASDLTVSAYKNLIEGAQRPLIR